MLDPSLPVVADSYVTITEDSSGYSFKDYLSGPSSSSSATTQPGFDNLTPWQALCDYSTYQPNTYVDHLLQASGPGSLEAYYTSIGQPLTVAYPYYGP